jgi:hypothetical protein
MLSVLDVKQYLKTVHPFRLSLQATLSEYFELEDDLAQVRSRDPFCPTFYTKSQTFAKTGPGQT